MPAHLAALACLVLCLAGCTVPLRCGPEATATTSSSDATLDGRLVRCSALGTTAHDDPDCKNVFAEARRRILPTPQEK
jgi:conjugative transfer region protein TrbK